jgi:hypothetical protein
LSANSMNSIWRTIYRRSPSRRAGARC